MESIKYNAMVYDCFPFFNELDILKLRLHILNPYVDRFVMEEARYTFSGQKKELCFEAHRDMFREFLPKIDYIVVDEPGKGLSTHLRDKFQKNHLYKGLKDASPNDMILLSDVDEIPDPDALRRVLADFRPDKIYHFAQRLFYCYLNYEEISGKLLSITGEFPDEARIAGRWTGPGTKDLAPNRLPGAENSHLASQQTVSGQRTEHKLWLGTKAFGLQSIPKNGIIELREIRPDDPRSIRVSPGGWHFGYMGSYHETDVTKRIGEKVIAAAHQEYNTEDILKEAADRMLLGEDMFGRASLYQRAEIDDSFPAYLREHIEDYDYLIMPEAGALRKGLLRLKLPTARFLRRGRRFLRRRIFRNS